MTGKPLEKKPATTPRHQTTSYHKIEAETLRCFTCSLTWIRDHNHQLITIVNVVTKTTTTTAHSKKRSRPTATQPFSFTHFSLIIHMRVKRILYVLLGDFLELLWLNKCRALFISCSVYSRAKPLWPVLLDMRRVFNFMHDRSNEMCKYLVQG